MRVGTQSLLPQTSKLRGCTQLLFLPEGIGPENMQFRDKTGHCNVVNLDLSTPWSLESTKKYISAQIWEGISRKV